MATHLTDQELLVCDLQRRLAAAEMEAGTLRADNARLSADVGALNTRIDHALELCAGLTARLDWAKDDGR